MATWAYRGVIRPTREVAHCIIRTREAGKKGYIKGRAKGSNGKVTAVTYTVFSLGVLTLLDFSLSYQ